MLEQDFCDFIEYQICKLLKYAGDEKTKGFWCDGVLPIEPDENYSPKFVNDNRQILLKAYIGKDGQTTYKLIVKFGNKSLSRYTRNLDIKECVPVDKSNWLFIDIEKKQIEIQLE